MDNILINFIDSDLQLEKFLNFRIFKKRITHYFDILHLKLIQMLVLEHTRTLSLHFLVKKEKQCNAAYTEQTTYIVSDLN